MSIACPSLIAEYAGGLCRAIDVYCERTSPAFDAEPVNAITNLAYFVSAFAGWRLLARHPEGHARSLASTLVWCIVAVGTGSFLFHTIATSWASWSDVIPILAFMLVFLWVALRHFFGWPAWLAGAAAGLFIAVTFSLEAFVSETVLWGGAYATPTLLVLVAAGVALRLQRSPAGAALLTAAGLFVTSFAFRTIDMPLCRQIPFGTHFMWHILNATLLFLLVRAAILHARPTPTHTPLTINPHGMRA